MKLKRKRKQHMISLLAIIIIAAIGTAGCTKYEKKTTGSPRNSTSDISDADTKGKDTKAENTSAEDNAIAKGRYVETQIDLPQDYEGMGNIRRLSDGSLLFVDAGNAAWSISADNGQTWDKQALAGLESIRVSEAAEFTSVALAEDGGIFISYIAYAETTAEKTTPERYLYFPADKPEENIQKFELGIEDYKTNLIETVFTADGRLFTITATMHVYEINLEKESCRQLFALENGKGADLCANEDFLIVTDGAKVYFYDLESGEITSEDEVLNGFTAKQSEKSFGIAMCCAKNGKDNQTLYLAGCNGITGHVIGGSVMEQLVDGALSSLGDPSKVPEEIIQNEDGSFLVFYEDGELYSYVYDADASAAPEQQLVIYGLYDSETVRQAVSMFRRKHPEVFVRFEVGLSSGNGMTRDDAVKNLNTELLAGTGPDMILLNDMPLDSYQEKGMLMDLSGLAADLERADAYFEGILNGYRREDGTYALPFRYQVPLLAGERAVLSEISDLKTLADEIEKLAERPSTEETVFGSYSSEELLEKLYLTSANAWIKQKQGAVDKAALKDFLTQAERIYHADQKNLDAAGLEAHKAYVTHIQNAYRGDKRAASKVLLSISRVFAQLQKTQELTAGYLTSMDDFRMATSIKKELGKNAPYGYSLWNGQDAQLFCPTGTIGISANSKNKEMAQEFIRVLFSSAVQGKDFEDGFPVNASAYEAFTKDPLPDKSFGMGAEDRDGNEVRLDTPWPDGKELKELKKIIQSLKTPAEFDESLKNEVITIGAQALRGEKQMEQSVEEIAQKMELHIME